MPFPVAVDNWILLQGESIVRTYNFKNPDTSAFDLTSYTLSCHLRRSVESKEVVLSPSLAIVGAATNGQATLTITAAQSDLLSGVYVFDIKATHSGGSVSRLVEGEIRVDLQITRSVN